MRYFCGQINLKGVIQPLNYDADGAAIVTFHLTNKEIVNPFTGYQIGLVSVFLVGIVAPFFASFPLFFLKKGAELLEKGAIAPLLRKKGGNFPLLIPKCTNQVFRWYWIGKNQEILTDTYRKIPIQCTT